MKTCPDCGREMEDGEVLCPLCGAAVSLPEETEISESEEAAEENGTGAETEGKRKSHKVLFAVAGVAVAAVIVAAVLLFGWLNDPRGEFLRQHKNLADELMAHELSFLKAQDSGEGYALDATLTIDSDEDDLGILADSGVRLKLDVDESHVAADGSITLMGKRFLDGSVRYEAQTGTLGFYLPQMSEKYYVADYATLMENLSGQEWTQETAVSPAEKNAAYRRVIKTYGDILQGTVKRSNVTKESGTYSMFLIQDTDWKGTAYTFRPTAQDLEELFLDLADALETDEDLPKLVNGFDEEMRAELVSELRGDAADMSGTAADANFNWTIRANGRGHYQVELNRNDGNQDYWVRFERTDNGLYLAESGEGGSGTREFSVTYFADEDTSSGVSYHGNAALSGMGPMLEFENVYPGKISSLWVPYGMYKLGTDGYPVMELNVAAASDGGTDHILHIRDYGTADGEGTAVTVKLHTTDAPVTLADPDAPVEDITDYTSEELEMLAGELGQNFYSVLLGLIFSAYDIS